MMLSSWMARIIEQASQQQADEFDDMLGAFRAKHGRWPMWAWYEGRGSSIRPRCGDERPEKHRGMVWRSGWLNDCAVDE